MTTNDIPAFDKPADHDYVPALLAYADALSLDHHRAAFIIATSAPIDTDPTQLALFSPRELAMRDAAQSCYTVVSHADGREYASYDTYDDIRAELFDLGLLPD